MSKVRLIIPALEKLSIINESYHYGVTQTLRKHSLFPSEFRKWKESFNEGCV